MNDPRTNTSGGMPTDLRRSGRWLIAVLALALLATLLIHGCTARHTGGRYPLAGAGTPVPAVRWSAGACQATPPPEPATSTPSAGTTPADAPPIPTPTVVTPRGPMHPTPA
jgi:hypothetical protein